jgi:hypothetical protein
VDSLCDHLLYAPVAIARSQTNIIKVGVLLDGDSRRELQLVGEAAAANMACAFQAAGTLAIGGSSQPGECAGECNHPCREVFESLGMAQSFLPLTSLISNDGISGGINPSWRALAIAARRVRTFSLR